MVCPVVTNNSLWHKEEESTLSIKRKARGQRKKNTSLSENVATILLQQTTGSLVRAEATVQTETVMLNLDMEAIHSKADMATDKIQL